MTQNKILITPTLTTHFIKALSRIRFIIGPQIGLVRSLNIGGQIIHFRCKWNTLQIFGSYVKFIFKLTRYSTLHVVVSILDKCSCIYVLYYLISTFLFYIYYWDWKFSYRPSLNALRVSGFGFWTNERYQRSF